MNWQTAVNVLKDELGITHTYQQYEQYKAAAAVMVEMAGLPLAALDWVVEGSWDGTETPEQVRAEWDSGYGQ